MAARAGRRKRLRACGVLRAVSCPSVQDCVAVAPLQGQRPSSYHDGRRCVWTTDSFLQHRADDHYCVCRGVCWVPAAQNNNNRTLPFLKVRRAVRSQPSIPPAPLNTVTRYLLCHHLDCVMDGENYTRNLQQRAWQIDTQEGWQGQRHHVPSTSLCFVGADYIWVWLPWRE